MISGLPKKTSVFLISLIVIQFLKVISVGTCCSACRREPRGIIWRWPKLSTRNESTDTSFDPRSNPSSTLFSNLNTSFQGALQMKSQNSLSPHDQSYWGSKETSTCSELPKGDADEGLWSSLLRILVMKSTIWDKLWEIANKCAFLPAWSVLVWLGSQW